MITSFYAGILGLLFFKISLDTISARRTNNISLGAGDNNQIIHMVSAHSNFTSYTPIFLILLYFLEKSGSNIIFLHLTSVLFVTGRVFHFLTMKNNEVTFKKRKLGMQLTLFPLIIISCLNIFNYIKTALQ